MDIKNPVIVTALYDIGRDQWETYTQSYGGYIHWMERTLSLDSYIVIYTQEKFKSDIEFYRKKYDTNLSKTKIIIQELSDIDSYKLYHEKLTGLMFSDQFIQKKHFDVPEMNRPLYNVIMFNKIFWLKNTVDNKYFDNDMVIWLDAGGLRESVELYQKVEWPNLNVINNLNNNKITFFSHNNDFIITDKEFHSLSQIRHIQGTSFVVPSHLINELTINVTQTIDECLTDGYIGSDEKIFDLTYCKDKIKYSLIKSTWREYFDILK